MLLSVLVLLASPTVATAQAPATTPKRVLVIHYWGEEHPFTNLFDQTLRSALQSGSGGAIEYSSQYLESYRFPHDNYPRLMQDFLRQKYGGQKPDVIVAVFDSALDFVLHHRNDLFPGVPVVYWVIRPRAETENMTGIWQGLNYRDTVALMLRLHPKATQVFVIASRVSNDYDPYVEQVRDQLREFENRASITFLDYPSLNEVTAKVQSLSDGAVILYLRQTKAGPTTVLPAREALSWISQNSRVPIYGQHDLDVGSGAVGGYLIDTQLIATQLSKMTLHIVNGTPPQDIPVEPGQYVPMFDWRQLQRFGISEASLPPGSIVKFREPSFWERYRWRIVATATLIALQAALIAGLLVERRRKQRVRESLDRLTAELEQRVQDRTESLAAKTRELETFAYSVAHDLKAPLRAIDGYARLLLEDYVDKLNEDGRSFLETIRTSSEEMGQLIEDLLDYSRLERKEIAPHRLELEPLITAAVKQIKQEAGARDIDFVMRVSGGTVVADANGLMRALRNYLENAVKFTRDVAQPRIEIGSEETPESYRVWVRDNGVGFDMKYHDQIFEIFQRLHRGEDYAGTGVGLAIVRKVMERIGGRAWAESVHGKGATFYLDIPKE